MSSARTFLELLFTKKPDYLHILIWTLQGDYKRSRWFKNVSEAAAHVESLSDGNVYVGVGFSPSDFGEFNRCKSDDVAGVVAFAADIDLKSKAHPKGRRPETIEQALSILPPEMPPSMVVETGNGIQCWWLLKEPWIFDGTSERQQAAQIFSRWQTLLKYACQRHGWAFERLKDLARVLRVPGTWNVKDPANPKAVTIREVNDCRYSVSDFHDHLDNLSIPSEDEQAQEAKKATERFSDKLPAISLVAEIPDDLLASWMAQDSRFRATWSHHRDDMSDRSQSGYDLALACFGIKNGLCDQQVVDLIVHNRRLHGAKHAASLDYYRRTISKARSGTGRLLQTPDIADSNPGDSAPSWEDATGMRGHADDPNLKAKRCDAISAVLGVQILRIVKLSGSEPVYLMETENGCIEFPDVGKLLSPKYVREALAAKAGKLIRRLPGKAWDQLAQTMLDACTEKVGTDDLEFEGAARIHITKYLSENPPLTVIVRLSGPNSYGPLIHKDRIAISSTDLQIYINRTTMQNLSVKRVAAMISVLGGEPDRVRKNSFQEQSRWALPVAEFNPKDYAQGHEDDSGHE